MGSNIKSLAMSVLQRHGAASTQSQPSGRDETTVRLPESVPVVGVEFPSRRCRACNGWLYWVSAHGAVICAGCHPPASRALVKTWHWLPEGEVGKVQ